MISLSIAPLVYLANFASHWAILRSTPRLKRTASEAWSSHLTFYPHSSPDLDTALSAAGAPGVFTGSVVADELYGGYNWACMPHARSREYIRPPDELKLKYVEVIQRHHKRTPYASNIFFKEDIQWSCAEEGPYHHARSALALSTAVYWQTMRDTRNPFEKTVGPGFRDSTCTFPSLTSQGVEDARVHGEDFAGVYRDMLHFLPQGEERDKYEWRVTNNVLTTQTLGE